jgi:hypothetical protein
MQEADLYCLEICAKMGKMLQSAERIVLKNNATVVE